MKDEEKKFVVITYGAINGCKATILAKEYPIISEYIEGMLYCVGDEVESLQILVHKMTQSEFEDLGEFEGF